MATFNETRAPTSRKYVAEEGEECQIDQKYFKLFGRAHPFLLQKENVIFRILYL